MIRKTLSAAGALGALAAFCSPGAQALAPATPIAANVFVGGATAQDPGFLLIVRTICQNNAIDTSSPATIAASDATRMDAYLGTDNQVYTCLANNLLAPAVPNGTAIAVYKTSVGGSGSGVIPLARQVTDYGSPTVQVRFLPVPTSLPTSCTNVAVGATVIGPVAVGARTAARYISHTGCGTGNRAIIPQVGISDVEPAFIDGATPEDSQALNTIAVNHGIFGFAVTESLRNALQAAQGLVSCSVARGDASREALANQPSLTRTQLAGITTGNIINWNSLTVRGASGSQGLYDFIAAQASANCPRPTALPGEGGARTFVIRRVPSSGTQAITEIWTTRQRCQPGSQPYLDDLDPVSDAASSIPSFNPDAWVQAYSSSSGVRNGLDRASGPWAVQAGSGTENRWAIGNLSCENTWASASGNRAYRFVKIHGATPGLRDTANGAYDFYAEQVVNTSNAAPPPAGLPAAFATYLSTNLADPDVLRTVNAGFAQPGTNLSGIGPVAGDWTGDQGQGCLLGVPDGATIVPPAAPITGTAIQTQPINTSWKRPLGFTNNCQDPVIADFLGGRTPVGGFNQATSQPQ
jgi:hypothetical protein